MQTETLSITEPIARVRALALLNAHQIIAAPTDTVYGLMCRFNSAEAIERLYEAKDRSPEKAIPVLISDVEQLSLLARQPLPSVAHLLIDRFWPGPLTLVLPALPGLPANLTAGQTTVAVRLPDHDGLRRLIRQAGPLAATSANLSGQREARSAQEVLQQLVGRVPLLLIDDADGRSPGVAAPSTIVDLTSLSDMGPRILRPGPIAEAVEELLAQASSVAC
jgi:L-threonylcarbamoyladenylate synthase